jgi:hypothetical protein
MDRTPSFTPLPATLLAPLPPLVQRYLRMALPSGIPAVTRIILNLRGAMRLKEGSTRWHPFTATEQLGLNPPEFVWRAHMRLGPLISATVVDEYLDGIGAIDARAWGVIPLVHPAPDPRLDEGALLRYLAEAVWFPVALLPNEQLHWLPAGNRCAVAVLRDANTEARLTCHFNARGEITRVEALRPYLAASEFLSRGWSGNFSEWREFHGMRIPTQGHVFWQLDAGEWEYWRGTIESVTCVANE